VTFLVKAAFELTSEFCTQWKHDESRDGLYHCENPVLILHFLETLSKHRKGNFSQK